MRILVIVRALNEEAAVGRVVQEARAALPRAAVLVVDDGSSDGTARVAGAAGARVLSLPANVGMCGAVQAGFRVAVAEDFDAAVQIDGDGQHRAGDARLLLAPIEEGGASVVVGSRFLAPSDGHRSTAVRRAGTRLLSRGMSGVIGRRITDATSGFRAVDRAAAAVFAREYPAGEVEAEALLVAHRHGLRIVEVPVSMRPRLAGRSTIGPAGTAMYGVRSAVGLVGMARRGGTPVPPVRERAAAGEAG
jgi:glycosyltransferase involved in cell wall biosynthesis